MATLITVTGRVIELKPRKKYVLGRGPECEIVIEDLSCSRRHARITVNRRGNVVHLEDLGSRNGTFVSDDRVYDRTAVMDGARLRIGTTVFLLQLPLDEPEGEEPEQHLVDSRTVAIEQLSLGAAVDPQVLKVLKRANPTEKTEFAGQLSALGLVELLQLLMQTRRSGTLHVEFGGGSAQIELREGEVVAANHADLHGFQALLLLVRQEEGLFWLVETDEECPRNVHEPASVLLVELCRAHDEQSAPR